VPYEEGAGERRDVLFERLSLPTGAVDRPSFIALPEVAVDVEVDFVSEPIGRLLSHLLLLLLLRLLARSRRGKAAWTGGSAMVVPSGSTVVRCGRW